MSENSGETDQSPEKRAWFDVRQAMMEAFRVHNDLGLTGTWPTDSRNRFDQETLIGDIEAEKAVIDFLQSTGQHIRLISEEHGERVLNDDGNEPSITAVLDGLDGSILYKESFGIGHYGTMLALLKGADPTYDDYMAAGIMEPATRTLFISSKEYGARAINVVDGASRPLRTDQQVKFLRPGLKVLIDTAEVPAGHPDHELFNVTRKTFSQALHDRGIITARSGSTAGDVTDLLDRKVVALGQGTRKSNLEFATAYALIKEAGGVMVTLDGEDIGPKKFLEFGQHEHVPVLMAANQRIADAILKRLAKHK